MDLSNNQAMDQRIRTERIRKIQRIVQNVHGLPPLDMHVTMLLKELGKPDTNVHVVEDLVRKDMLLTAHILRAANSAGMGYYQQSYDIREAIVRLGFIRIRNIVLGFSVASPLTKRLVGYGLKNQELWTHSVAVAFLSQRLATMLKIQEPYQAYVSGLLHDIGKVALDQFVREEYLQIIHTLQTQKLKLWQAEEELFGISHATLGGMMVERYNFPPEFVDAIRYHHFPQMATGNKKIAAVVNLADYFSPRSEGSIESYGDKFYHPSALDILGIQEDEVALFFNEVEETLQEMIAEETQNASRSY